MNKIKFAIPFLLSMVSLPLYSAESDQLRSVPLFNFQSLEYIGGFRLPTSVYGDSNVEYAEGPITLGKDGKSIYIVGHAHKQAVGEFSIPELANSTNVADFKYATKIQDFSRLLGRAPSGNSQSQDRIGGMEYIDGQLFVTSYEYYDASGDSTHNMLVLKDAKNLKGSSVAGFHKVSPKAHAAGWISPIPSMWQSALGGPYMVGASSGKPIISRWSVGPSAFSFDPLAKNYASSSPTSISAKKLMDFSLENPIGHKSGDVNAYLQNSSRSNSMWSHLARSNYGFVVPGTRTYMTVGFNGGMTSGVGYKINQDNGRLCDGYCAYRASDYASYYWLFDLNDLMDVKNGKKSAHDVVPYDYGSFDAGHASSGYNAILGGAFDYSRNILYVSLERGDKSDYGWAPSIVAFKLIAGF